MLPATTVAVICVGETTVCPGASVPPKRTVVAPVKFIPLIVITVPGPPETGIKLTIFGGGTHVKPGLGFEPPGVVTTMLPLAPTAGTTAVITEGEKTVMLGDAIPPKVTDVAPVKPEPYIVTVMPGPALVGAKLVIIGPGTKVNPAKVVVPPGVVTSTLPVAPAPTVALICVAEMTVNAAAGIPPKLTAVAPVKPVPIITTTPPVPMLVGAIPVIVGGGIKVNPPDAAVPPGAVTETNPLALPGATVAVICVAETTVKLAAFTPPKRTCVAPVKPVPLIVTNVPIGPLVGINDVIVGAARKVNPGSVPVPAGVVTDTLPLAPKPTVAVISVEDITVKPKAGVPPKLTAVAPVKFVPKILTTPVAPMLVGVKDVMTGEGMYVKPPCVAVPPGVVTCTFPDPPAAPTTAVSCVGLTIVKLIALTPPKLTAVTPTKFVPLIVTVLPPP